MSSLEKFVACLLRHAPDSAAAELADILWLAARADSHSRARAIGPSPPSTTKTGQPTTKPSSFPATGKKGPPSSPPPPLNLPPSPSKKTKAKSGDSAAIKPTRIRPPTISVPQPPAATDSLPLRVPGGRALPEPIALVRALRPLARRVHSRTRQRLDEAASAERIADTGLWQPVLAPERARWLELALVLDTHTSMSVWQTTLTELRKLLETLGAFRDVRLWTLDTSLPGRPPLLYSAHSTTPRPAKELVSPDGRRLVLLATDCLGPAWRDGSVATWLQPLAARQPVAIWQLLPERLWRQTHLRHAQFVHAVASEPGGSNKRLTPFLWRAQPGELIAAGSPIPVVNAEPLRLAAWARFLAGATRLRLPAVILRPAPPPLGPTLPAPAPLSAEQRVLAFRRSASPEACRLACLLAASVLRFPVMRLVQAAMLPGTGQTTLAEVFLGGLFIRAHPTQRGEKPDEVDYDFHSGVRELLLRSAWTPEVLHTHSIVSDYLIRHFGHPLDFRAMVAAPAAAATKLADERSRAFASVTAAVLRRLGGDYAELADRLVGTSSSKQPEPSPKQPARFVGLRILWVDDKPSGNRPFHKELPGAEIVEMTTTLEALLMLKDERLRFDAVISDLNRPEGKNAGLELLKELRRQGNPIPFGIFSMFIPAPATENAFHLGAFACTSSFKRLTVRLARQLGRDNRFCLPSHLRDRLVDSLVHPDFPPPFSHVLANDPGSEAWPMFWAKLSEEPIFLRIWTCLMAVAGCERLKVWSHRVGEADFVAAHPSHADALSSAKPGSAVLEVAHRVRSRIMKGDEGFARNLALIPAVTRSGYAPYAYGVLEFHFQSQNDFSSVQRNWLATFLERLPPLGRRLLFTPPDDKPLAWVLVAGAEKWPKGQNLAPWAQEVGAALADARFGLVCGGWPGVDEAVTAAYLKVLEHRAADPARFVRQIIEPDRKPLFDLPTTIKTRSVAESITRSIEAADAVVMIGGAGGTARIGREALAAGLPVLPLPQTGGDASKFFANLDQKTPRLKTTATNRLDAFETLQSLSVPLKKIRQPLIDLIRKGQRSAEAKERIGRLKENLIEALHAHDHYHLLDALNDTETGHYGVDDVELCVDHENLDLDRAFRRFTFRKARFTFNARLGSSREEDGIDMPIAKEISGEGTYDPDSKGRVSIIEFKINERLDLIDHDDLQDDRAEDVIP